VWGEPKLERSRAELPEARQHQPGERENAGIPKWKKPVELKSRGREIVKKGTFSPWSIAGQKGGQLK